MVVRFVETCPRCGLANPWRKGAKGYSRVVNGERRIKCFCRRCGAPEVIVYRENREIVPRQGTISR